MTSPAIVREALEVKFRRIMADCPPGHSNLSGQLTALREYMRAALASLDATPGEGVLVPREQLRDWYTQAFAMFVALTPEDDEDDRRTPKLMSEMEALFAPANPASEPAQ